jgi:hypothetical protein
MLYFLYSTGVIQRLIDGFGFPATVLFLGYHFSEKMKEDLDSAMIFYVSSFT